MGEHDGKPGVVADGADIAEVIGEALELRHQSAQPNCARRNFNPERDFNGTGEGKAIGGRTVAGCPPSEACGCIDGCSGHEGFDTLMV